MGVLWLKNTHKHTVSEHITTLSLLPFAQILLTFCVTLFIVMVIDKFKCKKRKHIENVSKSKIIILVLF